LRDSRLWDDKNLDVKDLKAAHRNDRMAANPLLVKAIRVTGADALLIIHWLKDELRFF
jgi:hypothetical protein